MKTEKIKSVPLRTCCVCKQIKPKKDLLRIVFFRNEEVSIDESHKANGRGAYICNDKNCVDVCIKKKILNRAFKRNLPETIYVGLAEAYEKNNRI